MTAPLMTSFVGDLIRARTSVHIQAGEPRVELAIVHQPNGPAHTFWLTPADIGNICKLLEDAREAAMRALVSK